LRFEPDLNGWFACVRDWCRLSGTGTIYIEPGPPWDPSIESFNGRSRDELLNVEQFGSLTEAKLLSGHLVQVGLGSPAERTVRSGLGLTQETRAGYVLTGLIGGLYDQVRPGAWAGGDL
jgi:Integrase core domain